MFILVPLIVVVIILVQIHFFKKNLRRMDEYSQIFDKPLSWRIQKNEETDFVSGISGEGNRVFVSIRNSINKYLGNNSGSVIDFQLLKDAVDRHCDSVENDINTLNPIPLYCGLAGTMAGVILGLLSLIFTGSITALLSSGSGNFGSAASGVNDLLTGVAWAMLASICGIILTTWGSLRFKNRKIKGEAGKNEFLAWLQARLLPELPSDTSDAMNRLVLNLNKFNETFAGNTTDLRKALQEVNEASRVEAELIEAVQNADVTKMTKASSIILSDLMECTDTLEQFLEGVKILNLFTRRVENLDVLGDLKVFFENHKAEISKEVTDANVAIGEALKDLDEASASGIVELKKAFTEQTESFKQSIQKESDAFEYACNEMKSKFSAELSQFPELKKKLSEISEIPAKLDKLIDRIDKSNAALASNDTGTMKQMSGISSSEGSGFSVGGFPAWMKWTIVSSAILIAVACLTNTAWNIWGSERKTDSEKVETTIDDEARSEFVDTTEPAPVDSSVAIQ